MVEAIDWQTTAESRASPRWIVKWTQLGEQRIIEQDELVGDYTSVPTVLEPSSSTCANTAPDTDPRPSGSSVRQTATLLLSTLTIATLTDTSPPATAGAGPAAPSSPAITAPASGTGRPLFTKAGEVSPAVPTVTRSQAVHFFQDHICARVSGQTRRTSDLPIGRAGAIVFDNRTSDRPIWRAGALGFDNRTSDRHCWPSEAWLPSVLPA